MRLPSWKEGRFVLLRRQRREVSPGLELSEQPAVGNDLDQFLGKTLACSVTPLRLL